MSNVDYDRLTVDYGWDISPFKNIPELVPDKPIAYTDINLVSQKFLRDLSMYDVFTSYDEYFLNKNDSIKYKIIYIILYFFILFFIFYIFFK